MDTQLPSSKSASPCWVKLSPLMINEWSAYFCWWRSIQLLLEECELGTAQASTATYRILVSALKSRYRFFYYSLGVLAVAAGSIHYTIRLGCMPGYFVR